MEQPTFGSGSKTVAIVLYRMKQEQIAVYESVEQALAIVASFADSDDHFHQAFIVEDELTWRLPVCFCGDDEILVLQLPVHKL